MFFNCSCILVCFSSQRSYLLVTARCSNVENAHITYLQQIEVNEVPSLQSWHQPNWFYISHMVSIQILPGIPLFDKDNKVRSFQRPTNAIFWKPVSHSLRGCHGVYRAAEDGLWSRWTPKTGHDCNAKKGPRNMLRGIQTYKIHMYSIL